MKALSGSLSPFSGQVLWNGEPTTAPLHRRARLGLAVVPEHRAVLMRLTVRQNLRVGRCDMDRALELFPELTEHLARRVGLLSGGQQQMLSVARALSRRPTVLLADELSLGLAPVIVDRLLGALRSAADEGVGVLLVEQHVHKALAIADRVQVMNRGAIVLSGAANEVAERLEDVQAMYFSAPHIEPRCAGSIDPPVND
jgi:ABC-type branched-subunit amino acid transport system ATPase component